MTAPRMYPWVSHDQLDSPVLLKEDISYVNLHDIFLIVIPFKLDRVVICDPTEQWVSKVRQDSEQLPKSPVILIATPKKKASSFGYWPESHHTSIKELIPFVSAYPAGCLVIAQLEQCTN